MSHRQFKSWSVFVKATNNWEAKSESAALCYHVEPYRPLCPLIPVGLQYQALAICSDALVAQPKAGCQCGTVGRMPEFCCQKPWFESPGTLLGERKKSRREVTEHVLKCSLCLLTQISPLGFWPIGFHVEENGRYPVDGLWFPFCRCAEHTHDTLFKAVWESLSICSHSVQCHES